MTTFRKFLVVVGVLVAVIIAVSLLGTNPPADHHIGAEVVCQDAIRPQLKAPASASFPTFASWSRSGDTFTVSSYVDAENSFGAKLRSYYTCEATWLHGDSWHVDRAALTNP